jgi:transposase InsO family protein/transposase-like protein
MPQDYAPRPVRSPLPRDFLDPDDELFTGTRGFTPEALRLLLACSRQITLGLAHALSRWWRQGDPVRAGLAERVMVQVELEKVRAVAEIQRARLERFPARQRKHYTPAERFRIVELMGAYGLGLRETARLFLVDPQTISRWQREALAEPEAETVGTLVRADPPLRGFDDVVKRLVKMLDSFGIGGSMAIAQMLARAGLKLGRETVRRYRKAPRPPRLVGEAAGTPRVLRAKRVNHIWTADLTEIRGFLGLFAYKLVVVLDLFSRFPLAFGIFRREPSAEQVVGVLDRAIRRHGRPGHFVSDQGSQFTAEVFRERLETLSIGQRFGAIGQYGSIAVIERFWRTLKELLGVKLWPPLSAAHLEARVELALAYYAHLRPHQGLGGATPAEVYRGETPKAQLAAPPPRKTKEPANGERPLPLEVVFLDHERRMPALVPARQAA